jgi:hypothetical protein
MALVRKTPNPTASKQGWRSGYLSDDLSKLKSQAKAGDLDAQAQLRMLKSIEFRVLTTKPHQG